MPGSTGPASGSPDSARPPAAPGGGRSGVSAGDRGGKSGSAAADRPVEVAASSVVPATPTLTAGPAVLRPWIDADAEAVLVGLADPDVRLWNGSTVSTYAEALDWVRRRADWTEGDHASFAIAEPGGGLLGSVSLHQIDPGQNDAEIGYWLLPAARGRGAATAAVRTATDWAFAALPVERITLLHAVDNVASGRVAARAGFTLEGRLRRSFRYGDGRKHDELLWSRLATDPPAAG